MIYRNIGYTLLICKMKKLVENFIKLNKRLLNLSIIFFAIIIFLNYNVFADGPGEIPLSSKKIAVVGDSYTGHFVEDEGVERFEAFIFPVGTISNEKNVEIFNKAIEADNHYILFATGVNDQALSISPGAFETTLREHVKKIEKRGKYLFLHTYMDYPSRQIGFKYTPNDYDRVLREIADSSENVFYIDMSGIDMNKYNTGDGTHYNKFFNDTLKSKLLYLTDIIDMNMYNGIVDWIQVAKKNQIAVAGDTSANLFYAYEKDKDFDLLDFTEINSNLIDNTENVMKALSSTAKNVLIFIGVKDYEEQVDLDEFEETLRIIANRSCETHKTVFIPTYMEYNYGAVLKNKLLLYDLIIKKVSKEYNNICYLDMHSYEKNKYLMMDDKYYNITFYDVLYGIIKEFIEKSTV